VLSLTIVHSVMTFIEEAWQCNEIKMDSLWLVHGQTNGSQFAMCLRIIFALLRKVSTMSCNVFLATFTGNNEFWVLVSALSSHITHMKCVYINGDVLMIGQIYGYQQYTMALY
jgi:hypothetical protein